MEKRGKSVFLVIIISLVVVLLLVNLASASLWSEFADWFKNLFGKGGGGLEGELKSLGVGGTNDYVGGSLSYMGSPDYGSPDYVKKCKDSDVFPGHLDGKNYGLKGTCTDNKWQIDDACISNTLKENFCSENICKFEYYDCSKEGKVCEEGKCIEKTEVNMEISVATLKDVYKAGEKIELTDPPEESNTPIKENKISTDALSSVYEIEKENLIYGNNKILKNEDINEFDTPESYGYIIQFKDKPVIEKKIEFDKEAKENKKYIDEHPILSTITAYRFRVLTPEKVPDRVKAYARDLETNNKKIKERILSKIKEKRTKITGKAISDENEIRVMNEFTKVFNGISLDVSESEAQEIKKVDGVKAVYPNLMVNITLADSVPLINADKVWQLDKDGNDCTTSGKTCLTGEGVTIAIVDTGVDYTHPDLGGCSNSEFLAGNCKKVIGGYDFVVCSAFIYGVCIEKPESANPMDNNGHGTHVAGIAAGKGDYNNNNIYEPKLGEVWGVAPDSKLYAYKVLNSEGEGYSSLIIAAIDRAVDPNQDEDFSDHVDIISMSLGAYCRGFYSDDCGPDDSTNQAVDNAVNIGVAAVIAAGNNGPYYGTISSPGTARKSITIGASFDKQQGDSFYNILRFSDCFDTLHNPGINDVACFSSRGGRRYFKEEEEENYRKSVKYLIKPDVVAPGVDICSAQWDNAWSNRECLDDKHTSISGTSMATPHVAGAVALIKQLHPDWTPEEIKMALRNTAVDIGKDIDTQGYGRIDVSGVAQLKGKPAIAQIETGGKIKGIVNIIGTATGGEFESYTLYYGKGKNPTWTKLITSKTQVEKGILYSNFDTSLLSDGIYSFKLIVENSKNEISKDIAIFEFDNIEITYPAEVKDYATVYPIRDFYKHESYTTPHQTYILKSDLLESMTIIIKGYVGISNFKSYSIEYGVGENPTDWLTKGVSLINEGKKPVIDRDGILGSLDISDLKEGNYSLKLSVKSDKDIFEEKIIFNIFIADGEVQQVSAVLYPEEYINYGKIMLNFFSDKIVWADGRNGNWDVYMYDLTTQEERRITNNNADQSFPSVYENKIVWSDNRDGIVNVYGNVNVREWDIYMCDLSKNGQKGGCLENDEKIQVTEEDTSQTAPQTWPAIYENIIVWNEFNVTDGGFYDIYMCDLSKNGKEGGCLKDDKKTPVSTLPYSNQKIPDIYENKIVWRDGRRMGKGDTTYYGKWDVYMYDLVTQEERRITTDPTANGEWPGPQIYSDKIVWGDGRNGGNNVYMYDLVTQEEKGISIRIPYFDQGATSPKIYENKIVWSDNRRNWCGVNKEGETVYCEPGVWDVHMYDLTTQEERRINYKIKAPGLNSNDAFIYKNKIAWITNTPERRQEGIYVYNLPTAERRPQSKIVNNMDKDLTGNLKMILQKQIPERTEYDWIDNWVDKQIIIDKSVTIPANGLLKLDSEWNSQNIYVDADIINPLKYRVYAKFESQGESVETSWEFIQRGRNG